jgi:hypothetical protein
MRTPVEYPEVILRDGSRYRIRFGLKAIRKSVKWGQKADEETAGDASIVVDKLWSTIVVKIAAGAHVERDGKLVSVDDLDPQKVRDIYDDDPDTDEINALADAIARAESFLTPSGDENSLPEPAPKDQ